MNNIEISIIVLIFNNEKTLEKMYKLNFNSKF